MGFEFKNSKGEKVDNIGNPIKPAKSNIDVLLEGILHGDDEHKEWLTEAIHCWDKNQPIPTPRGSGTKDKLYSEIQTLTLENTKLKENIEILKKMI